MKKSFSELPNQHQELFKLLLKQQGIAFPKQEILPRHAKGAPLSYAQRRLWFTEQMNPGSGAYNVSMGMRMKGEVRVEELRWAVGEVVKRHEVLRSRFEVVEGEPWQVVEDEARVRFELEDLREGTEEEREEGVRRILREEAERGFDLQAGAPLRMRMLRIGEQEYVLVMVEECIHEGGVGVVREEGGRGRGRAEGFGGSIWGLCAVAAGVAGGRGTGRTDEVLGRAVEGEQRGAGAANRLPTSRAEGMEGRGGAV
jgi:hypothetical protein